MYHQSITRSSPWLQDLRGTQGDLQRSGRKATQLRHSSERRSVRSSHRWQDPHRWPHRQPTAIATPPMIAAIRAPVKKPSNASKTFSTSSICSMMSVCTSLFFLKIAIFNLRFLNQSDVGTIFDKWNYITASAFGNLLFIHFSLSHQLFGIKSQKNMFSHIFSNHLQIRLDKQLPLWYNYIYQK